MTTTGITMRFAGRVASGLGEGRYFSSLDWLQRQLRDGFGFVPVPGTFNVRIDDADALRLRQLQQSPGLAIVPPDAGFCAAKCYRARVGAISPQQAQLPHSQGGPFAGALVIPLVPNYRRDVLEILAPVHLRQALGVADDDSVEVLVEVPAEVVEPARGGNG
jgi:riboflavin kinase